MKMTKLQIELSDYGPNRGKYEGRVFFENEFKAAIQIPLDDEVSRRVLEVCADQVVQAGKDAAAMITTEVIEAINTPPAIESNLDISSLHIDNQPSKET